MPNEDPSNASRRRKREARKALSLSLPDKESVHGIKSPILSEPIPGKLQLVFSRLLPLRGEERGKSQYSPAKHLITRFFWPDSIGVVSKESLISDGLSKRCSHHRIWFSQGEQNPSPTVGCSDPE